MIVYTYDTYIIGSTPFYGVYATGTPLLLITPSEPLPEIQLYKLLPSIIRLKDSLASAGDEGNLEKITYALEQEAMRGRDEIAGLTSLVNPDTCPPRYLLYQSLMLGGDMPAGHTVHWRRNYIKSLVKVWKIKGTHPSWRLRITETGHNANAVELYKDEIYEDDGYFTDPGYYGYYRAARFDLYVGGVRLSRSESEAILAYLELVRPIHVLLRAFMELWDTTDIFPGAFDDNTTYYTQNWEGQVVGQFSESFDAADDASVRITETEPFPCTTKNLEIVTDCVVQCELACQDCCEMISCELYCTFACEPAGCEGWCENNCQLNCEYGCTAGEGCQLACTAACTYSCTTVCEQACQWGCQDACQAPCQLACEDLCEPACQGACQLGACEGGTCQNVCTTGCMLTCELYCEVNCQLTCELYCEGGCEMPNCEVGCETSCEINGCEACEVGCEPGTGACEFACQSAHE